MNEPNPKADKPDDQRRFSQEQYDMLKRCSDKKDMTEWNEWRQENPDTEIFLEGACLKDAYLEGANLTGAKFGPESKRALVMKMFIKSYHGRLADFEDANLKGAILKGAVLNGACFKGADLSGSCLRRADLMFADLEAAVFLRSDMSDCTFEGANLVGTDMSRCNLRNANFRTVIADGATTIWKPEISRCKGPWRPEKTKSTRIGEREYTDFQGVGLEKTRIDPGTKQLLEYNIRRKNWEQWYLYEDWDGESKKPRLKPNKHRRLTLVYWLMLAIRFFWEISDYGMSTKRIILTFFKWAFLFATAYYGLGFIDYYFVGAKDHPGIVANLFVVGDAQEPIAYWLVPFRAIYFSIVTMTTLGFGDMYANAQSITGHILLTIQVILGYVFLGALITRFAVLFTAGGPAGRFADDNDNK